MEELSDQERDFSASASDSGPVEEEPSLPTADELEAIGEALSPAEDEVPEDWEEDAIRARLRQIRQDSAHIPVAEEVPGLLDRIKGLFRR